MTKTYRILPLLLGIWLSGWIYISWAAIQDDALIHLRYADNLFLHHFITYDGIHPDYGASSLLYVGLLALLRNFIASPDLPRAASTAVHGLFFVGVACSVCFRLPHTARVARFAGIVLLILVVMPSAVRWLDDGMETGIAISLASLLAWLIHGKSVRIEKKIEAVSSGSSIPLALLAFLSVMLRTELALLCGIGFVVLAIRDEADSSTEFPRRLNLLRLSPLLVGAGLALSVILATMHVLLPDTAVAKSHGITHWFNPIHDTAVTLGGAFSFGAGLFVFWLLTLLLVLSSPQSRYRRRGTLLANTSFPVVLGLACLRGQEIQGVRYFAWTLFFPIIWNILELAKIPDAYAQTKGSKSAAMLALFLVLLAVELPFETKAMFRVVTRRSETMRRFESQDLEVLRGRRGVASDIGYIGYFTGASICDLAGLVNGRAAAHLTSVERNRRCMQTDPDFVFGNAGQIESLKVLTDFSGWMVCGRYNFTNVRTPDTHFVVVRSALADQVCHATREHAEPLAELFAAGS